MNDILLSIKLQLRKCILKAEHFNFYTISSELLKKSSENGSFASDALLELYCKAAVVASIDAFDSSGISSLPAWTDELGSAGTSTLLPLISI